jgi:hypothetical protein
MLAGTGAVCWSRVIVPVEPELRVPGGRPGES